jgi:hypothetical protein
MSFGLKFLFAAKELHASTSNWCAKDNGIVAGGLARPYRETPDQVYCIM